MYHISMEDMIFASQSNPIYFSEATLSWKDDLGVLTYETFFGGNTITLTPAMFALY